MLCLNRLILTSGLFISFLGGISQALPSALDTLGLSWHQMLEAYKIERACAQSTIELEELDTKILDTISTKEKSAFAFLDGIMTLEETVQAFREADLQVPSLKKLHIEASDEFYRQQVSCWATAIIRRRTVQPNQSQSQKEKKNLESLGCSCSYETNPGTNHHIP